jgi:uncharacterized protein YeaO (DUF488 family)
MKHATNKPVIQLKRIYETPSSSDGTRILVDRLWPRGIAKDAAQLSEWFKDLAPSIELRKWFDHDPARWEEFQNRYHLELDSQPDQIAALTDLTRKGVVTLLYAAKDEQHNNAVSMKNYLLRRK